MKSTTWRRVLRTARLAVVLAISLSLMPTAQAQTFNVIHTFTGRPDGARPYAGLTLDRAGNLYGTASEGGTFGPGMVYRLRRSGSHWILETLHNFSGRADGDFPESRVVFGPDGALYGTTVQGGTDHCNQGDNGCGTVYKLRLPASICTSVSCPWTESVLYSLGGSAGTYPVGDLVLDQQGNIYGATLDGGILSCDRGLISGCGTVYKLALSPSGTWTETVLYAFPGPPDAKHPSSGVILDGAGNLYGMASAGGTSDHGAIYKLTTSGSDWTESLLYSFTGGSDGALPFGGLIFDRTGNLYGSTSGAGGTAYELTDSMGGWGFNLLYTFFGQGGPDASLTIDAAGNLYGTTGGDGAYGYGSVFKLSPSGSGWTYTSLHDFTGGSDGGYPSSNVVFDSSGNLYGTASCGGNASCIYDGGDGVVWEITP